MNDDLVRIEYKLDCIMQALADKGIMVSDLPSIAGIEQDDCPVCGVQIKVTPHFGSETVRYVCGCNVPNKVVPGISGLLITDEDKTDGRSRIAQDSEVFQPEKDRSSNR
jgi:hypothetical protein